MPPLLYICHPKDGMSMGLSGNDEVNELSVEMKKTVPKEKRPFQVGSVDKLKRNGFLYGILIISVAGGHFL